MPDALIGGYPLNDSYAVEEGKLISTEGPVFWAHPRTVAIVAHPRAPGKQLEHIIAALVRAARFRLELRIAALRWAPDEESGGDGS